MRDTASGMLISTVITYILKYLLYHCVFINIFVRYTRSKQYPYNILTIILSYNTIIDLSSIFYRCTDHLALPIWFCLGHRGFIHVCSLVGGQTQPIGQWWLSFRQIASTSSINWRRNGLSAANLGQSKSEQGAVLVLSHLKHAPTDKILSVTRCSPPKTVRC